MQSASLPLPNLTVLRMSILNMHIAKWHPFYLNSIRNGIVLCVRESLQQSWEESPDLMCLRFILG